MNRTSGSPAAVKRGSPGVEGRSMRFTFAKKNSSGVNRKHLNRRGRRDADGANAANNAGAASKRSAGMFETLEGRTMMSVTTDTQGWRVVAPAGDSTVIYV